MGLKIFNTAIKLSAPNNFKIDEIAKDLFGGEMDLSKNFRDNRYSDILISTSDDVIEFSNLYLSQRFFMDIDLVLIKKLFEYFKEPEYIISYLNSSHNLAAGYTIIERGKLIRSRYFSPDQLYVASQDVGEPLPFESKKLKEISEGENFNKEKGMCEEQLYGSDEIVYYHYVDGEMVEAALQNYLGYGIWDSNFKESAVIKLSEPF